MFFHWKDMKDSHRDGSQILVRKHNGVFYEYYVVWWSPFCWCSDCNEYPEDCFDSWTEILTDGENS